MKGKIFGMFACLLINVIGLHAAAQPSSSQGSEFVAQSAPSRFIPNLQQLASTALITHPAQVAQHLAFLKDHPDLKYLPAQTINNALLERIGIKLLHTLVVNTWHVPSVAFNAAGTEVASTAPEKYTPSGTGIASPGMIKIFDTQTGDVVDQFPSRPYVFSLAYNANGSILAVTEERGPIMLLNSSSGDVLRALTTHSKFTPLAVSSDWKKLAAGTENGIMRVWDFETGTLVHTVLDTSNKLKNSTTAVALNADGTILAAISWKGMIEVWDIRNKIQHTLIHRQEPSFEEIHFAAHDSRLVTTLAMSPDGAMLASSVGDGYIKLWNVQTGELLHTLGGLEEYGMIHSLAFSPDGTKLASGSNKNQIALWNPANGNLLQTLPAQTGAVYKVAFSPNGLLASATKDGVVNIWRVDYTSDFQTDITDEEVIFLLKAAQEWLAGRPYSVIPGFAVYQQLITRFPYLNDERLFAPIATPLVRPAHLFRSFAPQAQMPSSSSSVNAPEKSFWSGWSSLFR